MLVGLVVDEGVLAFVLSVANVHSIYVGRFVMGVGGNICSQVLRNGVGVPIRPGRV
jgi:hypothetical protein